MEIYFDKKLRMYIGVPEHGDCCGVCEKEWQDEQPMFHVVEWRKKGYSVRMFCHNCYRKTLTSGMAQETKTVIIGQEKDIGEDAVPYVVTPPQMVKSNISVFEPSKLPECVTVDRTVHAGRESIAGARIGADVTEMIAEKDKVVEDENKVLALFESVRNANPVIPEHKKKRLQHKR